ncbi:MAG: amidohydrolase family protein [Acidobacteriota bacterium]
MLNRGRRLFVPLLGFPALVLLSAQNAPDPTDFFSLEKIDAHLHARYNGTEFLNQAAADRFKAILIVVDHGDVPDQLKFIERQKQLHPDRFQFVTSFPVDCWDEPTWAQETLKLLDESFKKGAVGVKVWKNIGMELRDKNGRFVMIDDPRFDPVFNFIEQKGKTLTGHIGEPRDCWLPLDQMMSESNRRYYKGHPEYHMYLHPEFPSYEAHITAVEHLLEKHPRLRYVGCHVASVEWNLERLSRLLDRFPNMAVDLAARVDDLQLLDRDSLRQFCIKYQDRLLYATDIEIEEGQNPQTVCDRLHTRWTEEWKYFSSGQTVAVVGTEQKVRGLALPPEVLRKIYQTNAKKWYPGI